MLPNEFLLNKYADENLLIFMVKTSNTFTFNARTNEIVSDFLFSKLFLL